jgi:hypothetical protein
MLVAFSSGRLKLVSLFVLKDPCKGFSCLNGGTCATSTTGLECVCTDGYEGTHCEISK